MSKVSYDVRKTKTANSQQRPQIVITRNAMPFVGAFAGVLLSVPLSVALLSGMVRADVASAVGHASNQSVSMRPAAAELSCVAPTGLTTGTGGKAGKPQIHTAAGQASTPQSGSQAAPAATFITKLVGGTLAKNDISVTNTGPNAKSIVVAKNEITNTNTNSESNVTTQNATSGKAVVAGNQGATGDTSTGNAANTNSTSFVENANN